MKRTGALAAAVVSALVVAGIAVAHGVDGGKSVKAVSGTFTATATHVATRTCTTSDGKTVVTSDGTYTGTAAGDADLGGTSSPATLHVRSTIVNPGDVGVLSGTLKIDVAAPGRDTVAQLTGVYSSGQVAGLAIGHAHSPAAQLVANFSAGFGATTGFTAGKLGATAGGAAVEVAPAGCKAAKTIKQNSQAKGVVTAVSPNSITVAGLTCTVPTSLQAKLPALNSVAEIHCTLQNSVNTLVSVKKK